MTERNLVLGDFSDKIGDEFVISEDGTPPIAFTLAETELLSNWNAQVVSRPPFSLIFAAKTMQGLPQRLYQLAHSKLGLIGLFLVPVGRDERGFLYQALFN